MKKEQIDVLVNLLAQGKIIVPAEVRSASGRVLNIKARAAQGDKPARDASTMSLVEMHVEIGDAAYTTPLPVRLVLEDKQDPQKFAAGFPKGMAVFIEVRGIQGEFGRLQSLEASAVYAA